MSDPTALAPPGTVMTVAGPIARRGLGGPRPHEHRSIDFLTIGQEAQTSHGYAYEDGSPSRWDEPLALENCYAARRNPFQFRAAMQLVRADDAVEAARAFKAAGGGCIVDLTPIGVGRDPDTLREISKRSDVHVVMGTGFYVHDYHPPEIAAWDEEQIYELILAELQDGAGSGAVKPGIIGEIGLDWPVHDREQTVLRAACRAQSETGYCLTIHPGRDPAAPLDAVQRVLEAGGDPTRTIIGHLDRTLNSPAEYLELARSGCYLELDRFGLETSYYPMADVDLPNDGARIAIVHELAEEGFLERVLASLDVDSPTRLTKYGGEGYEHLLKNVAPMMLRRGFSEGDIDTILRVNPQRALAVT
jgi:phosphotriesterase-related protein